jgi:hypothetical protein
MVCDLFSIYEVNYRHLDGFSPNEVHFVSSKFYDRNFVCVVRVAQSV